MPALTIKNIPEPLYKRLKEAAAAHHRSLNSELIHCLEKNLLPKRIEPDERIQRAKQLRHGIVEMDADDIQQAIAEGRA